MIGDGWDGTPAIRPGNEPDETPRTRKRVAVVTGTRAEFGLLRSVMHAIHRRSDLELAVIAAGSHLIAPAETFREVKAEFNIADVVPMQIAGRTGRIEDAESVARGVGRFTRSFQRLRPDWVLVLGDRIEAFAAATSASISGFPVVHMHGGDRAEGVADEAMRHAITKLAHLHLPATKLSAERITRMGERADRVIVTGSPAIDELAMMPELSDTRDQELGEPRIVVLLHPLGRPHEIEEADATTVMEAAFTACEGDGDRILALHPNHDPGRDGVMHALAASGVRLMSHVPRREFVGLLKKLAKRRGVLLGNSSAGLIECAATKTPVVNVGHRQSGRERASNVIDVEHVDPAAIVRAVDRAREIDLLSAEHPFGDGHAGVRAADALASINPHEPGMLRKRNTY